MSDATPAPFVPLTDEEKAAVIDVPQVTELETHDGPQTTNGESV